MPSANRNNFTSSFPIYFLFHAWLFWLGLPVLYWINKVRVGTLVSFLVLFLIWNSSKQNRKGRNTPKLILWCWQYPDTKARQGHYKRIKLHANIPDKHKHKNPQKVLANQIQHYIKRIIHCDQLAFIPGNARIIHIHKSTSVICHINM